MDPQGLVAGGRLELNWAMTSPLTEELEFIVATYRVCDRDCPPPPMIARVTGTSPLVVDIVPPEGLEPSDGVLLIVRSAVYEDTLRGAIGQEFTVKGHVTFFA